MKIRGQNGSVRFLNKARNSMEAVLFLFSVLLISSASFAKTERIWLCKSQGQVRSVKAESTSKGCKAFYNKEGQEHLVGEISQSGACTPIVDRIKETLTNSNWDCKNISKYSETVLTEGSTQ